jgi:N-acetylmuramoyl-L-alanine amidase
MYRKFLTTAMSIVLLIAVYVTTCVLLPDSLNVNGNVDFLGRRSQKDINIDLTSKTVVIDSGHGGIDPGKKSNNGIQEKDINLSIAYKLKQMLEEQEIKVVMTRTDDNGLYQENDSNKKIADMSKRCAIIDGCNPDIVVSIHQNSFQSASVKGAQVFYYKHSAQGKKLAQIMQNAFKEFLDPDNRRVEKADSTYYMLVHTSAPTIIAECGFLSNPDEAALLNTDDYQQKVAKALYEGIIKYFTSA